MIIRQLCFREQCPVRMECLVFAIEHNIDFGIWGGCGRRARRRIKRRAMAREVE
jgi:WhiB family redox-sensing transcriptional regulator